MKTQLVCPRCGQDYLLSATIKPLNQAIVICQDCEAFWNADDDVFMENFRDFGTYVETKGHKADWDILDMVTSAQDEQR